MGDIRCPKCGEPWDTDTIHDEVERRFPNKPWLVTEKPEPYSEPDKVANWCSFRDENFFCGADKDDFPHTLNKSEDNPYPHTFVPHVSKSFKTWNIVPHIDKNTGLWTDEREYDRLYSIVSLDFRNVGCNAFNVKHNDTKGNPIYAAIYEANGDDLDAAASDIQDAEQYGYGDY